MGNEFIVGVTLEAKTAQYKAEFIGAGQVGEAFAAQMHSVGQKTAADLQAVTAQAGQLGPAMASSAAQATASLDATEAAAHAAGAALATAGAQGKQGLNAVAAASQAAAAAQAAATASTQRLNQVHAAGTISAAQHAAAMRMLPAQITDVVTSIASGMPVWLVAIQQGGQIKDSFGGISGAAQAMVGAITPATAAIGLLAVGAGVATAAYYQGSAEADRYREAIVMSGNAAGVTVGQLNEMAKAVSNNIGTQNEASRVLAEMTRYGKVSGDNLQYFTEVAMGLEKYAGQSIKTTVQDLAALGKAPLEASVKLNEQYGYLTPAVYRQIEALEKQGRTEEAAAVAQQAYAKAFEARKDEMVTHLGYLERIWYGVGGAAKWTWDQMLGVGRATTDEENLAVLKKNLVALEERNTALGIKPGKQTENLREEVRLLEEKIAAQRKSAQAQADEAVAGQTTADFGRMVAQYASNDVKRTQELAIAQQRYNAALKAAGDDAEARNKVEREYGDLVTSINKKFQERKSGAGQVSMTDTQLAGLRSQLEAAQFYQAQLQSLGASATELNAGERESLKLAEQIKLATNAKTRAKLEEAKAIADALGAQLRSNDGLEKAFKAQQELVDANYKDADALILRAQQQEAANAVFGKGRTAIEQMTLATLEHQLAEAEGSDSFDPKYIASLEKKIEAQKRWVGALGQADYKAVMEHAEELLRNAQELAKSYQDELALSGLTEIEREKIVAARQVELKYAKELAKLDQQSLTDTEKQAAREKLLEAQRIESAAAVGKAQQNYNAKMADQLNQSLTDALMRGFESGKGFAENLRDTVQNMFNTMVLRPVISAVMAPVSGVINGVVQNVMGALGLGGGSAAAGDSGNILGLLNNASRLNSLYGAATQLFTGAAAGASSASLAYANMVGAFGGDSLGALISANGGWAGVSTTGGTGAAGGASGLASAWPLAVVAGMIASNKLFDAGFNANNFSGFDKYVGAGKQLETNILSKLLGDKTANILTGAPVMSYVSSKLFGRKLKDQGFEGTFGGASGFEGNTYQYYKGGTFRSDKTKRYAMDESMRAGLGDQYIAVRDSVHDLGDILGLASNAIDGASFSIKMSLKGLSNDEINAQLKAQFDAMAETMAQMTLTTDQYSLAEERRYDTMQRLATHLSSFNVTLEALGLTAYKAGVNAADGAYKIIAALGGLGNYGSTVDAYYQAYYSEAEKVALTTEQLTKTFAQYGETLPETTDAYRKMVERYIAASESGDDSATSFVATLLSLSGTFKQVADYWKSELDGMSASVTGFFGDLQASIATLLRNNASTRKDMLRGDKPMTADDIQAAIHNAAVSAPSKFGIEMASAEVRNAAELLAQKQSAADATQNVASAADTKLNEANATRDSVRAQIAAANAKIAYNAWDSSQLWDGGAKSGYRLSKRKAWQEAIDASTAYQIALRTQLEAQLGPLEAAAAQQQGAYDKVSAAADSAAKQLADAQKALADAEAAEVKANVDYAAEVTKFIEQANGSVSKLSDLRGEVVSFYEAQAAAVQVMLQSASNLRASMYDVRFGQLNAAETAAELQSNWARNYSLALSTTGTTRAGYADKLTNSLPALSEALKAQSSSSEEWRIKLGEYIAQADKTANALEKEAEDDKFTETALGLLDSIDAALNTLSEHTKSSEQVIADAIKSGTESNLAGLRAIVAALQGKTVPAFAAGGQHSGGLRLVGELGPELEVTGAARYWSASQTRSMLAGNDAGSAELVTLLEQLVAIGTSQCQLLLRLVRPTERWDLYGTPTVRTDSKKVVAA